MIAKSFADVVFTNKVETQSFLEASDGLVQMFGTLFLLDVSMGFVQRGRVLSITVQKSFCFYFTVSNYNRSAHNVVNYRDASPFKDLFDSTVFGFVQSDLRSNIGVRLYFPPVCLNSSRYPHFFLGRLISSSSLPSLGLSCVILNSRMFITRSLLCLLLLGTP